MRASAGNLKRVSLELGGKFPDIVFADADVAAAVPGAPMAAFANSGPAPGHECLSSKRSMTSSRNGSRRLEGICASAAGSIRKPRLADWPTGIGATARARAKWYFVPPTVFADVRDDMRMAQEEFLAR